MAHAKLECLVASTHLGLVEVNFLEALRERVPVLLPRNRLQGPLFQRPLVHGAVIQARLLVAENL